MKSQNYKLKHLLLFDKEKGVGFDLDYKEYADGSKEPICCEKIRREDIYEKG